MAAKLTELMFNAAEQVEFLGAVLTYRQGINATFTELRSVIEKKLRWLKKKRGALSSSFFF